MTPEERELLNRSVSLGEDNNKMLRSMRRSMRFAHVMNAIYWLLIIGSAIGAFYFLQPYIDQGIKMYQSVSAEFQNVRK